MDTHLSLLYYDQKRLFHFLSRVIIVQEFETEAFYVLFVYKPTLPCYFLLNEKGCTFQVSSIGFSSYTNPNLLGGILK